MVLDREDVWRTTKARNRAVGISRIERMRWEMEVEKQWLERALVDLSAFENFYIKYRSQVFEFIRPQTPDQSIVDDLTNETFLRAMMNLNGFTWQEHLLKSWLFGIARNVVRQETRRKTVRAEVRFVHFRHDVSVGRAFEQSFSNLVLYEKLKKCKKNLSRTQVKIFEMHYEHEMTIKEISIEMGMPEPTVKSQLQRGRKCLKRELALREPRR